MEFTHPSKINKLENDWKDFIQNEIKLSPDKSVTKYPLKILTVTKDEDKKDQKQVITKRIIDFDVNLKNEPSSQSTKIISKIQYSISQLKLMNDLPASKIKPTINQKSCSILLPNIRKLQKSFESTLQSNNSNNSNCS